VKPIFQADADVDARIVEGVLRREPSIDFQSYHEAFEDGTADSEILQHAASENRILVSHDVTTMPGHFARFVEHEGASPGVLLIKQTVPISIAIEELIMIWTASDHDEWRDRITWLPL